MLKNRLKEILSDVLLKIYDFEIDFVVEEPPKNIDADFASNICFLLSKKLKMSPLKIAANFMSHIDKSDFLDEVFVLGSGFLNFKIRKEVYFQEIFKAFKDKDYFDINIGKGQKVLVEFVSANPTGPLHIGHARGACIGDSLARVLERANFIVDREYYVNDAGNQMQVLGDSLKARYLEILGEKAEFKENYYQGDYIKDIAKEVFEVYGKNLDIDFKCIALNKILDIIKKDLENFNIVFSSYFFETSLLEKGENGKSNLDEAIEVLIENKSAQMKDGALWLMANETGDDDKDRVIIRNDGRPTYFANDIAYHKMKFDRKYDRIIDIWGADHHGYVARLKASLKYLGEDVEKMDIILYSLVSLVRNSVKVAMSTRSGEFISLEEVINEVGVDATRFMLLTRDGNSPLDFDLELAKKKSNDNPVYYVQYAHARIKSIINSFQVEIDLQNVSFATSEEIALIKSVLHYFEVISLCVKDLTSHYISSYVYDLAAKFHNYYSKHRIINQTDLATTKSRILLINVVSFVIKDALSLLGVSAPNKM